MLPETFKDWASLLAVLLSIGALVHSWITSKAKVNAEHLKVVDEKLIDQDRRVQAIEGELKHLPGKDDVNDLKLSIAELRGTIGRLDESLSGISRTVRRVEGFLLKESE
ncbi:DUF2730 family protein [Roseibium sp.]|uniref:DUF2730 family protein n=1 Tax=Roseibium sp. TaxID=1936156 RepID=UPI003A97313D